MNITLEEMREIAKRLPIGYYLGMKAPVSVEPDGEAHCDVVKGCIHIGIGLLQAAADNIDASDAGKWDRETLLRCLLYHEVGHLLLTPKWGGDIEVVDAMGAKDPDSGTLVNIFEDERLECILSRCFMGVDFKAFVKLVHKNTGVASQRTGKFFEAVRLRRTTPELSTAVDDAVANLASVNASTGPWDLVGFGEYTAEINKLVRKILDEPEKKPENKSGGSGSGGESKEEQPNKPKPDKGEDEDESENKSGGNSESKSEEEEKEDGDKGEDGEPGGSADGEEDEDKEGGGGQDESGESGKPEEDQQEGECGGGRCTQSEDYEGQQEQTPREVGVLDDFLKNLAKQVFVQPTPEVTSTLNRFASRLSKKRGSQAAGRWSALHGKIDTRRDATDKDRIFRRRSDVGERLNSAVNLTLWVDVSGSFESSEGVLNQILSATSKAMAMSGGKLCVNVVKMQIGATVAEPDEWQIKATGGNSIDITYYDAWKKTRRKDRRNIDIVVFDGDAKCNAHCSAYCGIPTVMPNGNPVEVAIWNHPDCHILSDVHNKKYFDRLNNAHVTYMHEGYAESLQSEVLKILDRIL